MKRLLIGLVILAALTGCSEAVTEPQQHTPQREAHPVVATRSPGPASHATRPNHLKMAGIDAPVVHLALSGNTLVPPSDPTVLGWWGRHAGAPHGVTLLVGHTVHTGGGDLDDLEDVPIGSTATVSGHQYRVTSNEVISKAKLARRAPRLFEQTGAPRLVVVTCEGYDPATGHYDSNVVLTATPV